jgi:TRAP-type mannitol/chloroaromatic compound transport system permease small subunit
MERGTAKKTILDWVLNAIDTLSEWTGRIVSILVPLSALVVLFEILARQFGITQNFALELSQFMFGATFVLGGANALKLGAHVTVDIVWTRLTPRQRAIVDLVTSVFFFIYVLILIWKGWDVALRCFLLNEHTDSAWAPIRWPVKMLIPVGAFLILIQGLAKYTRDFRRAIGKGGAQ